MPLNDTWTTRDLPVLRAAAEALESDEGRVDFAQIATDLDLTEPSAGRAVGALSDAGYITWFQPYIEKADGTRTLLIGGGSWKITERGRRAVGLWPSADMVDALVDALRNAEQTTSDPEEQSSIRRAAGALLSVPRDVMVDVMAALIARQMGA